MLFIAWFLAGCLSGGIRLLNLLYTLLNCRLPKNIDLGQAVYGYSGTCPYSACLQIEIDFLLLMARQG